MAAGSTSAAGTGTRSRAVIMSTIRPNIVPAIPSLKTAPPKRVVSANRSKATSRLGPAGLRSDRRGKPVTEVTPAGCRGSGGSWELRPQAPQREGDGIERRLLDGIVFLERGEQQPVAVVLQAVDFQGAGVGVHQPQVRHALAGVDGHLQGAVGAGGGRRQDLAGPVGGELEPGGFRQRGHAFTAPAGDIGDDDVAAQVQLRFVENPPAAGTALAPIEWVPEIAAQRGISLGMFRRGARMGVQLAEENLSHQVFREGEEVFVGGVAFGRFVHDMFPVALVRILAPSPTRFSTPLLQNG